MVVGEPILVVGDSPRACSQFVWALVELIKPIPFGGDFRPYFTIQVFFRLILRYFYNDVGCRFWRIGVSHEGIIILT